MKRFIFLCMVIMMVLLWTTSVSEGNPTISFDAKSYTVAVGRSINIKTIITPKKQMKLEWSSSNEKVATVTAKGVVKGISAGETVITVKLAENKKITASCKVSVVIPVAKVTFSDKNVNIPVNATWNLAATVMPKNATNKTLEWSSSNKKVATVNKKGVITGVSVGTAKVTAVAKDGSKAKAVINIKVEEYDIVFREPYSVEKKLYTNKYGAENIKFKSKNKVVEVRLTGTGTTYSSTGIEYMTMFTFTPKKVGTDTVTFTFGKSKVTYKVYVAPDAFDVLKDIKKQMQENEKSSGGKDRKAEEKGPQSNKETSKGNKSPETKNPKEVLPVNNESKIKFKNIPWGISYQECFDSGYLDKQIYVGKGLKDGIYRVYLQRFEEVAGWPVESASLIFVVKCDESGKLLTEPDQNSLFKASYLFYHTEENIFQDLYNKLMDLYGPAESLVSNKKAVWHDHGVRLELEMNDIQVSLLYAWEEGEQMNSTVSEIVRVQKEKEMEEEQNKKANNYDGL